MNINLIVASIYILSILGLRGSYFEKMKACHRSITCLAVYLSTVRFQQEPNIDFTKPIMARRLS